MDTAFSQPISEESPSGDNLEYDSEYLEMFELFEPRAKAGSSAADEGREADPPDWKGVSKLASGLLRKTHDCRVLVCASISALHTSGIEAFRDHVQLLHTYLSEFWDSVYPQLDAEDDNDATMRMNAIEALDEFRYIVPALEQVKLVELKGMGHFGVREVDLAQGKETPRDKEEVPDVGVIRQAFVQTNPDRLQTLRAAAQGSIDLLQQVRSTWEEKTDGQPGPDFNNGFKALARMVAVLDEFTPSTRPAAVDGATGELVEAAAATGAIRSRADVVRVLDNICEYYAAHEPSSPIPLLLRRAQRLVEKSFMEILQDIVPDSVTQARLVSGKPEE